MKNNMAGEKKKKNLQEMKKIIHLNGDWFLCLYEQQYMEKCEKILLNGDLLGL